MGNILITGGVKSGKSSFGLELSEKYNKKLFIATAEAFDQGMKERIRKHKEERKEMGFDLIEEPIDISGIIEKNKDKYEIILIDCITLWLNNILFYKKDFQEKVNGLCETLKNCKNILMITNEVGLGVMGENSLANEYIDKLGILNKKIGKQCENVYLMVCGNSLKIK